MSDGRRPGRNDREPGRHRRSRFDRDRRDEAVAAAVRGLDVRRRLRIVLQRAADLADADLERAVADVDVGPRELEQLVLGDELPAARDEVLQDGERLRRERHHGIAAAQLPRREVQPERPERTGDIPSTRLPCCMHSGGSRGFRGFTEVQEVQSGFRGFSGFSACRSREPP